MKKPYFDIKPESSYNAYLSNGSLEMGMKKSNCIAWMDIPNRSYWDHIIEAGFRLDSLGGYAAAGIIFRVMDEENYYLSLVSSKGYFRLDVVTNNSPRTLIAWTEISDFDGTNIKLNMIAYGASLVFLINDKWVGEVIDDSVESGQLGFALASYNVHNASHNALHNVENNDPQQKNTEKQEEDEIQYSESTSNSINPNEYTCKVNIDYISIDTRFKVIEEKYKKWTDDQTIDANSRLRLAETYVVMGNYTKALEQINKAWKRRDETVRSVAATDAEVRTLKELQLAAQLSFYLGQYEEAEKYFDLIIEQFPNSAETKLACLEKMKMLNEQEKFKEIKNFVIKHSKKIKKNIDYYTILGRCFWELKDYINSAAAWNKAYENEKGNGVYAVNAANALEIAGKKDEAVLRFMDAGRIFLNEGNDAELAVMIPRLSYLGKKNWEARALVGKWAYSLEDYDKCAKEFTAADKLRKAQKPIPKEDPAMLYLWGLTCYLRGNNQKASIKQAIRMLEKAVKLAPDYELFNIRLEEFKTALSGGKAPSFKKTPSANKNPPANEHDNKENNVDY